MAQQFSYDIESYINGKERLVKETEKKRWTGIKRSGKANK
ncbi:hypothetical protein I5776_15520 [Heyndrickxia vini]|uniref:Uncharacterized protein n=1 Tax=Heyndrickxia vini TaxID=1476025 RepID=A0ABX7DYS4_9BACI|nr:hypothetical protein I5776_15520 [Heyndrickxia vini]